MTLYVYRAKCLRVVDGDTVDLDVDLGFNVRVKERFRLARIDTPEVYGVKKESEEYKAGKLASARVRELILNKQVRLETIRDKKGKYGRYIAEIFVGDVNVNSLLLEEGLAKEY